MTTAPNLKREKQLKVPLNEPEAEALRQFCARIGAQAAPFVRKTIFAHMKLEMNRTAGKRRMEWPRHGHMQRFPGRAVVAGGFQRMRL
jgi:hypothetical protein